VPNNTKLIFCYRAMINIQAFQPCTLLMLCSQVFVSQHFKGGMQDVKHSMQTEIADFV
jgi:hypothetical protein